MAFGGSGAWYRCRSAVSSVRFVADGVEVAGIRLQATEKDSGNHCIAYPQVGPAIWVLLFNEEK